MHGLSPEAVGGEQPTGIAWSVGRRKEEVSSAADQRIIQRGRPTVPPRLAYIPNGSSRVSAVQRCDYQLQNSADCGDGGDTPWTSSAKAMYVLSHM